MTLLVTVETGDMTQVLASRAGNVGAIDIGGWGRTRVVLSPLLVGGRAILGTREMWGLVLRMPSRGCGGLVSRIPG